MLLLVSMLLLSCVVSSSVGEVGWSGPLAGHVVAVADAVAAVGGGW